MLFMGPTNLLQVSIRSSRLYKQSMMAIMAKVLVKVLANSLDNRVGTANRLAVTPIALKPAGFFVQKNVCMHFDTPHLIDTEQLDTLAGLFSALNFQQGQTSTCLKI